MEVGRVLVLLTILLLVVAKYTTRTTPKAKDIDEIAGISKKYKIKPRHRMEPVIFEPQKIRLSRSTYKVNNFSGPLITWNSNLHWEDLKKNPKLVKKAYSERAQTSTNIKAN